MQKVSKRESARAASAGRDGGGDYLCSWPPLEPCWASGFAVASAAGFFSARLDQCKRDLRRAAVVDHDVGHGGEILPRASG
jgi:hypothetical protein